MIREPKSVTGVSDVDVGVRELLLLLLLLLRPDNNKQYDQLENYLLAAVERLATDRLQRLQLFDTTRHWPAVEGADRRASLWAPKLEVPMSKCKHTEGASYALARPCRHDARNL